MSPIHLIVWIFAFLWQVITAISMGGWLAGYGPILTHEWTDRSTIVAIGVAVWAIGLSSTIYHDEGLREIRRAAMRHQNQNTSISSKKEGNSIDKLYLIPQTGLFRFILYPHYLSEWIEWLGFWLVAGTGCVPARSFLINEVATMLPRALQGKAWYVKKFGADRVGSRGAVIPGL
jgi:3-oxo-5-alpha-steroid 4-dehydrogenase 1